MTVAGTYPERASGGDGLELARAVADAVLYEGYLLYPYRRSSPKNRVRWQFGVLLPQGWLSGSATAPPTVSGAVDSAHQQVECLLDAPADARLLIRLRFLHLQVKTVEAGSDSGGYEGVASLVVDGRTEVSFEEAVPREVDVVATVAELRAGVRREIDIPGGAEMEPLVDGGGSQRGRILRHRLPLSAAVHASAEPAAVTRGTLRVRVRIENRGGADCAAEVPRNRALRHAMIATHCLLATSDGEFISLLDPPEWAGAAARACDNQHVFPVLAGEPGSGDVVLASPIILYDHPRVAPESAGDLFDATEIDEILSLRTLTLTDAEKREARATDARAAAIVDRVDAMPDEVLARLHGAVRSLRLVRLGPGDAIAGAGTPAGVEER